MSSTQKTTEASQPWSSEEMMRVEKAVKAMISEGITPNDLKEKDPDIVLSLHESLKRSVGSILRKLKTLYTNEDTNKPKSMIGKKISTLPRAKPMAKRSAKPMAKQGAKRSAKQGAKPMAKQGAKPMAKQGAKPMAKQGAKPMAKQGAKPKPKKSHASIPWTPEELKMVEKAYAMMKAQEITPKNLKEKDPYIVASLRESMKRSNKAILRKLHMFYAYDIHGGADKVKEFNKQKKPASERQPTRSWTPDELAVIYNLSSYMVKNDVSFKDMTTLENNIKVLKSTSEELNRTIPAIMRKLRQYVAFEKYGVENVKKRQEEKMKH